MNPELPMYFNVLDLYVKFGGGEKSNEVLYALQYPVPYKGLIIHPVKTAYYMFFHAFTQVFFQTKYDSGIDECMGMNPLQFLFYQNEEKGIDNASTWLPLFGQILLLCLQKNDVDEKTGLDTIAFIVENNKCFFGVIKDDIQVVKNDNGFHKGYYDWYDYRDYEQIRDIICAQNSVVLPDYRIHPDIRKKLAEKDAILARINKRKVGSFEELVDSLMLASHYSEEYIYNLSIRRFTNLLQRYDIMTHYELATILSPNMDKKDRENILAWNSAIPKQDQYLSKVTNLTDIEKTVNGANNTK